MIKNKFNELINNEDIRNIVKLKLSIGYEEEKDFGVGEITSLYQEVMSLINFIESNVDYNSFMRFLNFKGKDENEQFVNDINYINSIIGNLIEINEKLYYEYLGNLIILVDYLRESKE